MSRSSEPRDPQIANDIGRIVVFGFALAMLLPIVVTPYLGDDIFNSYVNGAIGYGHTTFWQFIRDVNAMWIRNGRFFPGAFVESYGLFHIMPSIEVYKAFQVAITVLIVLSFYAVMRVLRTSVGIAALGTTFLICTLQMRQYHDGLLGFSGNIEFITELTLLSLLCLLMYLRDGKPLLIGLSLILYGIGLFTYEVTYLLWVAFLAVLLLERSRASALRLALPYAALSALVVALQIYVKATAHTQPDADYNVRVDVTSFAMTFAKQAFSAFPLTYVAIDPSNLFARGSSVFSNVPIWIIAAIFCVAATATWIASSSLSRVSADGKSANILIAVGAVLWITPAILVASSARYQRELVFGLGHVPVYIEYYGVTMIALGFVCHVVRRLGSPANPVRYFLCVLVAFVAVTTYASNSIVIAASLPDKEGMQNMHAGLQAGLMHGVPSGSELYVDASIAPNRYLDASAADAKYFYYLETGTRLDVHSIGTLPRADRCNSECPVAIKSYELINVPIDETAGYGALGLIKSVALSKGQVRSFAEKITVFVRGVPLDRPLWVRFVEHGCGRDRHVARMLDSKTKPTVITQLSSRCGSIEVNTFSISVVPESLGA